MADFTDLQIQFRPAKKTSSDGMQTTHEVVASIDGTGAWRGESTIDYARLAEAEQDPRQYGQQLGEILFNPAIMNALRQARGLRERPVRIRLWLETESSGERGDQHGLRWERAFVVLNGKEWPLALAPDRPFSRYVPAESIDSDAPNDSEFRLLVVFANPDNLAAEQQPIDVNTDLATLLDGIDVLAEGRRFRLVVMPGRTPISDALKARLAQSHSQIVAGPSTIDAITTAVHDCHGLHIVAHGTMNPQTQRGSLVLEDKDGHRAFAFDDDLYPWIHPDLRVVVLQSCHSAAPTPKFGPPFVGIGPRLVQLGVPAVVAMQDYVAMDDARVFAAAFYRSLVRDGLVDVATNEGRRVTFEKSGKDNFSVPALFMRLKGGRLWQPDPLRTAVIVGLAELKKRREHTLPTRAVQSLGNSLDYDPEAGPPGAVFDTPLKLLELSMQDKALVVLVGPRGMAKGPQLQSLFRTAAERFLNEDGTAPAPVSLALRDVVEARGVHNAIDRKVATLAETRDGPRATASGRPLLLIIDGDADVAEDEFREALRLLVEFRASDPHRIAMTLDEGSRAAWDTKTLEPTAILVARPMDFARVCQYLKGLETPAATDLHKVLEERQCRDVAGMPWLLEQMLALTERKVTFDSRATLLREIANECLSSIPMGGVPRACSERALEEIAWRMQWGRRSTMGDGPLYEILAGVRKNREYRLVDLKEALVRSGILAPAGDGIRFRYESLQAYYAARYLATAPNRQGLIEDITASLGRLSRARWWENTLVTMAGLPGQSSEQLLQAILAGSTLVEGDQVYLASRCFLDARKADQSPEPVVDQIVDALIWRSHPGNLRPYADRKRAVTALAEVRHPNAIPHLVSLASEEIATGWGAEKRYEFSGIRLIAVNGLMLMRDAATAYVLEKRPALVNVLAAWGTAYEKGDVTGLVGELQKADKATSPIAAFALGFSDRNLVRASPETEALARQTLLDVFAKDDTDRDVGWAVTDTFTILDPTWVSTNVIKPRLQQFVDPRVPYLIGWLGVAAEEAAQREYLEQCLVHGIPAVQARALRALGSLRTDSVRPLCESVVAGCWAEVRKQGINLPAEISEEDKSRLQNAAMESLRVVGNDKSIEALRTARRKAVGMTMTLRQLSFDVAEDIYWRLTGGLSGEGFDMREG